MTTLSFDRRLTPARADRAAAHLRGRVDAATFVDGVARSVVVPVAPLRREPRLDCGLDTEAVRGETVTLYEETAGGWAWVQLARDGYVGYMVADALGPASTPTHRVAALRSFIYPAPDLKRPAVEALSLGSRLAVSRVDSDYAVLADGWIWARHLKPVDEVEPDFVAVAERFLGVPYLWGGKSSLGLDCSGLVQVALDAAGVAAPRDSDLQENALGKRVASGTALRRGDLVFWPGHVGIMCDASILLHANAQAMAVTREPLAEACGRIQSRTGADVRTVKRLDF